MFWLVNILEKVNILDIHFSKLDMQSAAEHACALAHGNDKGYVVTPNAEIVYACLKDKKLAELINGAAMTVADGAGVVLASKILKGGQLSRVPGVELGEQLCARLAKTGGGLFLYGAKPGVAQTAAEKLCEKYPGLNICGVCDGYVKDTDLILQQINQSGAGVVFVCLGSPRQEFFMAQNLSKTNAKLMVGLGGSLDIYSGTVKRAPKIFRRLGLEWFYRLITQPSRIGRMMSLPKFLIKVVWVRLFGL